MSKSKSSDNRSEEVIEGIKSVFLSHYIPADSPSDTTHFMCTFDIFYSFQRILPSKSYTKEDVGIWLMTEGFKLFEMGDLKFEWMVKTINTDTITSNH